MLRMRPNSFAEATKLAPKVPLFDLGGVLVEFVGLREARKLLPHAADAGARRQN